MRLNYIQEVRYMVAIDERVMDPKSKWNHAPSSLICDLSCGKNWYISGVRREWELKRREAVPGIICIPKQSMITRTDILHHSTPYLLDNLAIREVVGGKLICKNTFSKSDLLINLKDDKRRYDMVVEEGCPHLETTAKLRHMINGT